MKDIICLIPARAGSKRVKDKNIREIRGHRLIDYSIQFSLHLGISPIISTNLECFRGKYNNAPGLGYILWRPEALCGDGVGDFEVVEHALRLFPAKFVVYLRPTTPFRTEKIVLDAIKTLRQAGQDATGLRSVEEMPESSFKTFTLRPGPFLVPLRGEMEDTDLPNQIVEPTFKGNGYVDVIKSETIEDGKLFGNKCIAFKTPRTIEIDTEEDLQYAEWWAGKNHWREEIIFK